MKTFAMEGEYEEGYKTIGVSVRTKINPGRKCVLSLTWPKVSQLPLA